VEEYAQAWEMEPGSPCPSASARMFGDRQEKKPECGRQMSRSKVKEENPSQKRVAELNALTGEIMSCKGGEVEMREKKSEGASIPKTSERSMQGIRAPRNVGITQPKNNLARS